VSDGLISGRFRLGELLGTGGSASVFAAVDERDGGSVALKILHPHLSSDAAARESLFREARAAAGVHHPNIVAVLDTGVHDDALAWISLELVGGSSLGEFVGARGPLGPGEALALARGILSALDAAHAAGLVHRDVSPANVMVATAEGRPVGQADVRLVDFGLADATGRSTLSAGVGDAAGGLVGNVNYLSPEQAEGREIDARGDLYQVGAVLYFALTGRAPFARATVEETMRAHVSAPPPVPSVRRAGVPRAVDRIVVKAMLKQPDDRFQSALEMLEALDTVTTARAASSREVASTRTRLLDPLVPAAEVRDETTLFSAAPPRRSTLSTTTRPTAVRPDGVAARPPVAAPPEPRPARDDRSPGWAIAVAIVLVACAVAWLLSTTTIAPPRPADAAAVATPSVTAPPTSAPVVPPPTTVKSVEIPDVAGGTVVAAAVLLDRAGLVLGTTSDEPSASAAGTVLRSSPAAASRLAPGTAVNVVVASGYNTVPTTAGLTRDEAAAALTAAGFGVVFAEETDGSVPRATVLRTEPAAAATLPLARSVTVVLAAAPASTPVPTPSPAPAPTGTPAPPAGG